MAALVEHFCHPENGSHHPTEIPFFMRIFFPQFLYQFLCIKQKHSHKCKQRKKPDGDHKGIQPLQKTSPQMDTAHQRNCRIFHGRQGTASKTAQQDHIQNCKNTYGKPHCRMHGMHQLPPICYLHIGGKKCKQKQWHQTKKDSKTTFHQRPDIRLKKAIQKYRENLTALSEYNNFSADEEIHIEQDFKKISEKELRDFKGMLIRDYNDIIRCVQKCRETLAQTLNKIARQEAFQDASYKTPLENMLKVCDNAAKLIRLFHITLESKDSLMKQLEVEISL